mmetsp:Transcript_63428/g.183787  ORF Transcript_63428/g.183787 Transcript_63428/m.183787 type:complete len:722 (-) Transcript_63428:199-2364(-)
MREWRLASSIFVVACALGVRGTRFVSEETRNGAPRANLETADPYDSGGRLGIRIDEASVAFEGIPNCVAALQALRATATAGKKETANIDLIEWKRRQMLAIRHSLMHCSWRDSTAIVEVAVELIFDPAFHPDVLHQLVTPWVHSVCQRCLVEGAAESSSSNYGHQLMDVRRSILDGIQRRLLEVDNVELLQEDTPYLFALQLLSQSPQTKEEFHVFFEALSDPELGPRAAKRLGHLARFLVIGRDRGERAPRWARWARSENAATLHPEIMSALVNVVWDEHHEYTVTTRIEAVQQWLSTQIKMEANPIYRIAFAHMTAQMQRFADGMTETGHPKVIEAVQEAFANIHALRATTASGEGMQENRKAFKFGTSGFPYSIALAVREFRCDVGLDHPLCADLWFISQQHIWFMDQHASGIRPPLAYRKEAAERTKSAAERIVKYRDTVTSPRHQDVASRVLLWILHHRGETLFSKATRVIREWLERSAKDPYVQRALEETLLVHGFDSDVLDFLVPARRRGVRFELFGEASHNIDSSIRQRARSCLRYLDAAAKQEPSQWTANKDPPSSRKRKALRWAEELEQPAASTTVAAAAGAAEDLADFAMQAADELQDAPDPLAVMKLPPAAHLDPETEPGAVADEATTPTASGLGSRASALRAVMNVTAHLDKDVVTPDFVSRIFLDVDQINAPEAERLPANISGATSDLVRPDDLLPQSSPSKRSRIE